MSRSADPTDEAARRGCLMANSTCELASGDADVRAQAQYTFDTMIALIADGVASAKATCRATRTRPRWRGQCWPPWKG